MNRATTSVRLKWVTGLIPFAAIALIALFLVDRSPSRTLQRLGFSDEVIHKIRNQAKRTHYRWSIDENHPSYFRARFNDETNHEVPAAVANNIREFVRESAEEYLNYPIDYLYLRKCVFRHYGATRVLELPDGKLLYVRLNGLKWTSAIQLQVYDPETRQSSPSPTRISERHYSWSDIKLLPHDNESLFTIRHLRDESNYEIGIRSMSRNGTFYTRDYTFYLVDDSLDLRSILKQPQEAFGYAKGYIRSDIEHPSENELHVRYSTFTQLGAEQVEDIGYQRYRWIEPQKTFEHVESVRIDNSKGLDTVIYNWIMPELAPTNYSRLESLL